MPGSHESPPVPRPPSPPVGSRPPGTGAQLVPGAASGDRVRCYPDSDAKFLDQVSRTLSHEWLRLRGGVAMDPAVEQGFLKDLLAAFQAGRVIPGYYRDADTGKCSMYWPELACFARWYAQLDQVGREMVLDELETGNPWPWTASGEYEFPPRPAPCEDGMTEQEIKWCCPDQVMGDPIYARDFPFEVPRKRNWGLYGALIAAGVAVVGAAIYSGRR